MPARVGAVVIAAIGLVPYLPIFYSVVKAVCPALVIVAYDMLAYTRPFRKILRRIGAEFVAMLNGSAKTIKDLCSRRTGAGRGQG